jgi:hypothetical protein
VVPGSGDDCNSPPVQYYVALVCPRMRDLTFMAGGFLFWSRRAIVGRSGCCCCIGSASARFPIPYSHVSLLVGSDSSKPGCWFLIPFHHGLSYSWEQSTQ